MKTLVVTLTVLAIFGMACTAEAAPFQNGSFEDYNVVQGNYAVDNQPLGITGWEVFAPAGQGNASPWGITRLDWGTYQIADGYNAVLLCWMLSGGIRQTFDTIPGHRYRVDFQMAGSVDSAIKGMKHVSVSAPSVAVQVFTADNTGKTPTNVGWEPKSFTFTTDSTTSTIAFWSWDGVYNNYDGPYIDNVQVTDEGPDTYQPILIQNGSFESATVVQDNYAMNAAPNGIDGWQVFIAPSQGDRAPWGITRMGVPTYQSGEGGHYILLCWMLPGGIQQSISTVPGHKYKIDFLMAGHPDAAKGIKHLWVSSPNININQEFTVDTTGNTRTNLGWQEKSYTFIADNTTAMISFWSMDAYYNYFDGPCIDNVRATDLGPVASTPVSIADAKKQANTDQLVRVSGVITATFDGYFYIEATNRSNAIRVQKSGYYPTVGNTVEVVGQVLTLLSDEVYILANSATETGGTPVAPLAMNNKTLVGGDLGTPPQGQAGALGAAGLNNIGLLVRTTGLVSDSDYWQWFKIDDGSGVSVGVFTFDGNVPMDGDYVTVTGICSCENTGSGVQRLLLATSYEVIPR